jgi:hypothetical protein
MVHRADERRLAAAPAAIAAIASAATAATAAATLLADTAAHLLLIAGVTAGIVGLASAAMTATAPATPASSAVGRLVLSLIHVVVLVLRTGLAPVPAQKILELGGAFV